MDNEKEMAVGAFIIERFAAKCEGFGDTEDQTRAENLIFDMFLEQWKDKKVTRKSPIFLIFTGFVWGFMSCTDFLTAEEDTDNGAETHT